MLLPASATGLSRDSVALVFQVMTIDKDFLDERVGSLGRRQRDQLDAGLMLALDVS